MASRLEKYLNDPIKAKKVHKWLAIFWLAASIPICIFLSTSVPFLVFISVYAVVASHWAGWDAAGGELEIERIKRTLAEIKKRV